MIRVFATAALALTLSTPLALAGEKSVAQQRLEEGTKRIQQELDAAKYDVAEEAKPSDSSLVEQLATPRTAEILLRKNVNNSQVDEVRSTMDVETASDTENTN